MTERQTQLIAEYMTEHLRHDRRDLAAVRGAVTQWLVTTTVEERITGLLGLDMGLAKQCAAELPASARRALIRQDALTTFSSKLAAGLILAYIDKDETSALDMLWGLLASTTLEDVPVELAEVFRVLSAIHLHAVRMGGQR